MSKVFVRIGILLIDVFFGIFGASLGARVAMNFHQERIVAVCAALLGGGFAFAIAECIAVRIVKNRGWISKGGLSVRLGFLVLLLFSCVTVGLASIVAFIPVLQPAYIKVDGPVVHFGQPPSSPGSQDHKWGELSLSSRAAFIAALDKASTAKSTGPLLQLNSTGGQTYVANSIANAMRNMNVTTEVPRIGECKSACVVVFLAGKIRRADPDAVFLIHESDAYETDEPRWLREIFRPLVRLFDSTAISRALCPFELSGLNSYLRSQGVIGQPWYQDRKDCSLTASQIVTNFPGVLDLSTPPRSTSRITLPDNCGIGISARFLAIDAEDASGRFQK